MKRRDLLNLIGDEAAEQGVDFKKEREGSRHTVYSLGGLRLPIPRHRDINDFTAEGILKTAAQVLGRDWWK
jgi:hypothetical protein